MSKFILDLARSATATARPTEKKEVLENISKVILDSNMIQLNRNQSVKTFKWKQDIAYA